MLGHKTISLYGAVQGVFLRRTIERQARQLGVVGFVENRPDGSVYIEAEGTHEALNGFIAWLKAGAGEGPHQVKRVEVDDGAFRAFDRFEIVQ